MKSPSESVAEYKAHLLENNTEIVEKITSTSKSQYQHYQSQHQAFVNHALQQIQVSRDVLRFDVFVLKCVINYISIANELCYRMTFC